MRAALLALFAGGCYGSCVPAPEPLPEPVRAPVQRFQGHISYWRLPNYALGTSDLALAPLQEDAVPAIDEALSSASADIGGVMLQPGAGQGGGMSVAQPTQWDTTMATWAQSGRQFTLALASPYDWRFQLSSGSLIAWGALGTEPHLSIDLDRLAVDRPSVDLRGALDVTIQGGTAGTLVVDVHHVDGDRDLHFAGEDELGGRLVTTFELDKNASGSPTLLERHTVTLTWRRPDLAGRADATITGGDLGATVVTAAECWVQGGSGFRQVYYEDSGGLRPTVGTPEMCAIMKVP